MIINSSGTAGYIKILKQMMYGWKKTRKKGERFLKKRERHIGERRKLTAGASQLIITTIICKLS